MELCVWVPEIFKCCTVQSKNQIIKHSHFCMQGMCASICVYEHILLKKPTVAVVTTTPKLERAHFTQNIVIIWKYKCLFLFQACNFYVVFKSVITIFANISYLFMSTFYFGLKIHISFLFQKFVSILFSYQSPKFGIPIL
jgi:hypothetical protein